MSTITLIFCILAVAVIAIAFAAFWAAAVTGARSDRRTMVADGDAFTPSMDRFGYVQDARNRGDV